MNNLVHCLKLGYLNYELEAIKDAMDDHIRYSTVILNPKTGELYDKIKLREGLLLVRSETTPVDPDIRSLDFFEIKSIHLDEEHGQEDLIFHHLGEVFRVLNGTDADIFWEKVKAIPNYLQISEKIFKKTEYLVYTKEEAVKFNLKKAVVNK
jgi:hypothetical protein